MRWIRGLIFALPHFVVVGAAQCLAFVGSTRLAEALCNHAAVWLKDADLAVEVAFIRSRAGDLEGALEVLGRVESLLPEHQWLLLRSIYSGIFCERNRQPVRAIAFFEAAMARTEIPSDTRAALQVRVARLRPVPAGGASGA
jgi:hypothetical protein